MDFEDVEPHAGAGEVGLAAWRALQHVPTLHDLILEKGLESSLHWLRRSPPLLKDTLHLLHLQSGRRGMLLITIFIELYIFLLVIPFWLNDH